MRLISQRLLGLCGLIVILFGCGAKKGSNDSVGSYTAVEQAFMNASSVSGVPVRLMMAAAFVESGLRADKSSAAYLSDGTPVTLVPSHGESVFGFSLKELGIDESSPASLTDQIAAYGNYLKVRLESSKPSAAAATTEEKMRWIWSLAKVHRGEASQRNLLAIFSRELIGALNKGFSVHAEDGMVAHLEKESNPLREQDLPENYRQDLQLDMYHADIRSAHLFSLVRKDPNNTPNHPKTIEVVHCPFSLSTCIQMQKVEADEAAPLGAHYLIPSSDAEVPGILQFAHHDESVSLIGYDGKVETINNRIIVMLTGLSGRYHEGQRIYAEPLWMTDFQLRLLSAAVHEICAVLTRAEDINREECVSLGGEKGVKFRVQKNDSFRWGDVVDFDETIISPYLVNSDGILGTTVLTLSPDSTQTAGSSFRLNAGFQASARRIELERLVRCASPDRRVVWEPVAQRQVLNVSSHSFENVWYDAGPNGTGDQFFRVKASGDGGRFLGWSTKRVQQRGFQKSNIPEMPSKYCLRNGT